MEVLDRKLQENAQQSIMTIWNGETITPRIIVAGKTGVGKSGLLNALMNDNVYETGVIPTTRENNEELWSSENGDIIVIDAPGLGEAEAPNTEGDLNYENNIKELGELKAHMLLLILKCDDRAVELEKNFIDTWKASSSLRDLPIIIAINQIDKMKPVRMWEPNKLNLKTPCDEKSKNIRSYIDYISGLDAFEENYKKDRIIPVSAGETHDDPEQYGIENLKGALYKGLPDAAKTMFARASRLKKEEAQRIIKYYSGSVAAAVGANFIPASDALIIAPIQIAMIIHLGKLHDMVLTKSSATGLLASAGMSFTGRFIAQELLSFFPGFKNVIGPPLAFGLTHSLGTGINELFSAGQIKTTKQEFADITERTKLETESAVNQFKIG